MASDRWQAIYGWRGAACDAMDRIAERFTCDELPLSVCWRCGTSIVALAAGLGAPIEAAPGKSTGEVIENESGKALRARDGQVFRGSDLAVAAEKAGLEFGDRGIFHRMPAGERGAGPVFSMANMLKPGSFDMANIRAMETPAIAFFLTLPAPLTALDAWEKMLPTVQRMAELLDGVVLDDSRNALGRQRIAHIRDELRAYDRQHQAPPLTKTPRW